MKKLLAAMLLAVFALTPLHRQALAAQPAQVHAILANPSAFDGQEVAVSGTVTLLKVKNSKSGNTYTTFKLWGQDGFGKVGIFSWGALEIKNRQRVEVIGTFFKVKKVGRYAFRNQIEATDVKPLQQ